MATTNLDPSAKSALTSRQQRELKAARNVLGEAAEVQAFARGRAKASWSDTASWITGIFAAVFVGALLLLHVVLIPGFLVVYVLYDAIRPRRGVAVTNAGVVELKLSAMNGKPASALTVVDHAALFDPRTEPDGNKIKVAFGAEGVSLLTSDIARLRATALAAAPPTVQPGPGTLPPPPEPQLS